MYPQPDGARIGGTLAPIPSPQPPVSSLPPTWVLIAVIAVMVTAVAAFFLFTPSFPGAPTATTPLAFAGVVNSEGVMVAKTLSNGTVVLVPCTQKCTRASDDAPLECRTLVCPT